MGSINSWINEHWGEIAAIFIVGLIVYALGSRILGIFVRRAVRATGNHHEWQERDITKRQDTLIGLSRNLWRIMVIFTVIYGLSKVFLPNLGTQLAPLFASAGIVGIALGFGAQSLIKDFISGIFIISENQYRVGDIVDLDGASGTVQRIGSRSTVLRDVEGNVHFLPNGMVGHVINKTMDFSKARLTLSVVPDTDIDKATKLINSIGNKMAKDDDWKEKIIEAPQYVMMGDLTATSADLIVSGKVQPSSQWSVSAELRRRILVAFEKEDIELGLASTSTAVVSSPARRGKR